MTDVGRVLREASIGGVTLPGDPGYPAATAPDNASFAQRPAAVLKPSTAEHVSRAVRIVAESGLRLAVQATGHGAGRPVTEDEVLLDTSGLVTVAVDATRRTARVGAGATWPVVQAVAARHGLLGLSGTSPTVGIAGYTFGGGVGWLVRKHGLASAALRAVDYVDGLGRIRRAADDAPDAADREALWAFRGGAPVGVATSLDIGLVPVADLWTGYLLWPAEELAAVAAAWSSVTSSIGRSVTSDLSLLALPPQGPFPPELLGRTVVHLSYASPDGAEPLEAMRSAVRAASSPIVDTTAAGTLESLAAIHLDPPVAVPARGIGRWLSANANDVLVPAIEAARVGARGGLSMIEFRHAESPESGVDGAITDVPGPFLLHAVGAAADDDARQEIDGVLHEVEVASRSADLGRTAASFREGQPSPGDSLRPSDLDRLQAARRNLDPQRLFGFHRDPTA